MENNSNPPLEGDEALLNASKNLRVGRNAATQTPEMPRHAIAGFPQKPEDITTSTPTVVPPPLSISNLQPPPTVIVRVDDNQSSTIQTSDQEQKIFAIPDVVVQYFNDSSSVKDGDSDLGEHNMAFDISDEYTKPPSRPSSRLEDNTQTNTAGMKNNLIYLHPTNSNKMAELLSNSGNSFLEVNDSGGIYYSLPRNYRKSLIEDIRLHSQPSTPILNRALNAAGYETGSSSSLCYFQPAESSPFSEGESLNFSYKPLDGMPGVFTISGRRTVIGNREAAEVLGQNVVHLMSPIILPPEQPSPKSLKKFEFSPMPPEVDRKRRKLQCFTDALSLVCFVPGLLLAILTPILIIPLFSIPQRLYIPLIAVFFAVGALSTVIIAFAGILGNIVWHYDERKKRLRIRMHCGNGPTFHYWGNGLYYAAEEKKQKELIV